MLHKIDEAVRLRRWHFSWAKKTLRGRHVLRNPASSKQGHSHSHVLPVTSSSSPSICIKLCTFYSASQFLVPTQIDSNRLRRPAGGPQFMMIMTCRPEGMLEYWKKTYSENLRNTFLWTCHNLRNLEFSESSFTSKLQLPAVLGFTSRFEVATFVIRKRGWCKNPTKNPLENQHKTFLAAPVAGITSVPMAFHPTSSARPLNVPPACSARTRFMRPRQRRGKKNKKIMLDVF